MVVKQTNDGGAKGLQLIRGVSQDYKVGFPAGFPVVEILVSLCEHLMPQITVGYFFGTDAVGAKSPVLDRGEKTTAVRVPQTNFPGLSIIRAHELMLYT